MALVDFQSQLEAADSVLDLARRLGARCLESEGELMEMMAQPATRAEVERIELWAGQASHAVWEGIVADPAKFEDRFGARLTEALTRAKTRQPLDFLAVLRALCRRPLPEFFRGTGDQVDLDEGLPIPFARPPLPEKLGGGCTTSLTTLNNNSLLDPMAFELFRHPASGPVRVVLDFSHAERIDELTWSEKDGLPRIATVHPEGGGDLDYETTADGHFFNVRPKRWDPDAAAALLAQAREANANLAVLPELSLPDPGALEELIAERSDDFPPLVVAGSAHCVSGGGGASAIRANESRIYLDGRFVALARKHHPFQVDEIDGEDLERPLREHLTGEKKTIMVLSGRHTRLAVAICADLLEQRIPELLVAAGVNLLLVPAMTRKIGSFNTALTAIAGHRQGVAAVANTRWADDGKPFLCMCAVPREDPSEQSAALAGNGNPAPMLGIFDPNQPLPGAVAWL